MTEQPRNAEPTRADLGKDPSRVSGMFDEVAAGYDRTNTVLSLGNDKLWRIAATRAIAPERGQRILDLAAGTGASSVSLARSGAEIVAADFSAGMIAEGERRHGGIPNLTFAEADAMALPFADGEFDTVTISFGLRNVNDPDTALREMLRVTRPGGTLVICEFSHPQHPLMRGLYGFYNDRVLPLVARAVSSNPDAYDYLNESIRDWPDQLALSARIRAAGWDAVEHRDLTFGIVALHRARKPLAPAPADRELAGSVDAANRPEGATGTLGG
ncbi:class I SAM-dependent methyltransferase [Microbacterium sp. 179-B 1A2 NHS]|uniref:class I SAM-dependent methyltransferase n=1 Tax=Microbacterium sp. 179-B 1A2 NHS TaxID=3142383 RepID=UPI0039A054EF